MSDQRPTIILVHGAFAESASWNGVIERLGGYDVVAAANPLRSLPGDAAYVADVMRGSAGRSSWSAIRTVAWSSRRRRATTRRCGRWCT
ncbi:hypothetical protein GCM10029963_18750 [Micromonospora andamanensis]